MTSKCKKCKTELDFTNIRRLQDLDFERVGYFCTNCFTNAEEEIKTMRFVEEYKGVEIYSKGNKYGLWGATYYFTSLEDARTRIDNKHLACVDTDALRFLTNQMN